MVAINQKAPDFNLKAFQENVIKRIKLSDLKGKWVILFFYPADFSFICPKELAELANKYDELKKMGVEVLSISTDKEFSHKAWHDSSSVVKKIRYPMLSDPTGGVCRAYETYVYEEGLSVRATFIIDPDGIIKVFEMQDNDIGRNIEELMRKLKAAKFVREHPGELASVNWFYGEESLKPITDLIGKI